MDNLIHSGEIPVQIGIFITPGVVPAPREGAQPRFNRSFEYDAMGDRYARFLIEEILPEVGKSYSLSSDPNDRLIAGASSGAICAFNAAWERPAQRGARCGRPCVRSGAGSRMVPGCVNCRIILSERPLGEVDGALRLLVEDRIGESHHLSGGFRERFPKKALECFVGRIVRPHREDTAGVKAGGQLADPLGRVEPAVLVVDEVLR